MKASKIIHPSRRSLMVVLASAAMLLAYFLGALSGPVQARLAPQALTPGQQGALAALRLMAADDLNTGVYLPLIENR